jgi:hypothetical protein
VVPHFVVPIQSAEGNPRESAKRLFTNPDGLHIRCHRCHRYDE